MNILCKGSLGLLRVISFISLVNLANAPELDHLSLPDVCVGEELKLLWQYTMSSVTAGNITWTFDPSGQDNEAIVLAVMNVPNFTSFQVNSDVAPRYHDRLSSTKDDHYPAGIKLKNVIKSDEGKYGIRISIDKPKPESRTDVVEVSLIDVTKNYIVLDSIMNNKNITCSLVSNLSSLSWNVLTKNPSEYKLCNKPPLTEWRKDDKLIATRKSIAESVTPEPGFVNRLSDYSAPLGIVIRKTEVADAGSYTVTAIYDKFSIKSDAIQLQVSIPTSISMVADIRQCVGTNVTLPWTFKPGRDCENIPPSLDHVAWTKTSPDRIDLAKFDGVSFHSNDGMSVKQDKSTNAGIILLNVKVTDAGMYEVLVVFKNGANSTASTNVTVDTPPNPNISTVADIRKCVGTDVTLPWVYERGKRCENIPQPLDHIAWSKTSPDRIDLAKFDGVSFHSNDGMSVKQDKSTNAGIILLNVKVTDAGMYEVLVVFKNGANSTASTNVTVDTPPNPNISTVADIRQCVGTDVTLPWVYERGKRCENIPQPLDHVAWTKTSPNRIDLAKFDGVSFHSNDGMQVKNDKSNAGIILLNVKVADAGTYEVRVVFKNGESSTASTNVEVETPQIPTVVRGSPPTVEMCEDESFVFNWTLKYPKRNSCPYAKVIGRSWYSNDTPIYSVYDVQTTTTKKPSTSIAPTTTTKDSRTRVTNPQRSSDPVTGSTKDTTVGKTTPSSQSPITLLDRLSNQESGDLEDNLEEAGSGEDATPGRTTTSSETLPKQTFSADDTFDKTFNAGLAVYKVKLENSGSYSVSVSLDDSTDIVNISSEDSTNLQVMKAPVVSQKQKNQEERNLELCTDGVLHLEWILELNACSSAYDISWSVRHAKKKTEVKIGSRMPNQDAIMTTNYNKRVTATNEVSLEIRNLTVDDSGTYIVRLTYITDQSVNISRRPDLKGDVFSESAINVSVFNSSLDDCTGARLAKLKVRLTRNGEDVGKSTNKTVFLNDTVTLSIHLPSDAAILVSQFFWKEMRHKFLKQFFGKKFHHTGNCSLQFKILKSLPGVRFQIKEYRREVQFGMKMIYMEFKNVSTLMSFYYRNHKYPNDPPPSGAESKDSVCSTGSSSDGDSIKVFIRVRPLVTEPTDVDLGTCLEVDKDRNAVVMRSKSDPKVFTFDEVADKSVTQESVFCSVGKKIIDGCVGGYNGTIFAYGQTGSGKTFTMLGPHEDTDNFQHELRGVIPRSFEYLFKLIKKEQEIHGDKLVFLCKCSFLEIYNEQIFDLLDTSTSSLQLRENIRRGVYVEGVHEQVVSSAHEAYQVLNRGWMNRTVASTTMNRESSRSHAVFTVSIESKVNQNGVWNIKMSQLHLVDLAGSERQKDTNTTGQRLKEAGSINRSLSALGNVIMALVDVAHGKTRHIPYRDSKLSFLLRDSLGGNSKTYIVACVHPGSKCFGETLSTLHFARRAKMIKNKAVVNEDTHGSITHMQAEIKRLKETLLQYQQNSLVKIPSASSPNSVLNGSGDGCLSPDATANGPSAVRYRFFFLQAMLFRNKSETEKRVVVENLKKQQEVCNRKEQALRQMKMVLKFREDALRKIEKAQKEKIELSQDDKDDIIESLRSEVKTLQAVVDHHPEVIRYQMDNESLKAEMRCLRADAKNGQLDQQKAEELERLFMELQSENGETGKSQTLQHQQTVPNNNSTFATIEKQKAQMMKLQAELDTLSSEMADKLQKTQRLLIGKEAELVGMTKAKEELEKLFKAHQIRSQIERETRDDLHAETIKIMTTPKKGGNKTRNSLGPGFTIPTLALSPEETKTSAANDDAGGDMIGHEAPPVEWTEEQVDGLREEISKLQDELRALKIQLEEADRNMVNLVQDKSLLEAEKELREKLHSKETKSQEDKIFELATEVTRLAKDNSDYLTREKILTSELQDLRIMSEANDKKLTEVRNEAKEYRTIKDKEVAQFETELMKLSIELGKVKEDLELASEERDQLQEREETLQATLDFTSEQLKDTEEDMKTTKEEIRRLEVSLKNSVSKVEELEQDKEKLLVQLQQETGVKDQRLMEALETIEMLRRELQIHQSQLAADIEKMAVLEQNVGDLGAECERLLKADLKKEEVLSSMTSRVTELKTLLQERESALEDVTIERKELRLRNEELSATCQQMEERLLQQTATSEDATNKLQQMISAREAEYEMLQEDYQGAVSRVDNLGTQLDSELQRNSALSEKQTILEKEIVALKSEIEKLHCQSNDYKSRLELTLNEKQDLLEKDSEIAEHVAEKQQLHVRSVELEQKLSNLQSAFDVISSQLDGCKKESVSTRMELDEEKKATEQLKTVCDEWQAKHQKLQLKSEMEHSEWQEKREEVAHQLKAMEEKVSTAETQAWSKVQDLVNENKNLKDFIESLNTSASAQEAEITRLRDCANDVYVEMDKLYSRNEELQEELLRQKKITDKIESDLCVQLNENAKLSGHQNHLQKIAYVDRLKDQVIRLEKDNRVLTGNLEKCKCKQLVLSSTPTRVTEATDEKH